MEATARDVIAKAICWGTERCNCADVSECGVGDAAVEALLSAPEPVRLELAALLNPWRPIKTASKDEPILLGWQGMRTFAVVAHWIRDKWRLGDTDEFGIAGRPAPKWWLPLPAPPSEDKP